MAIETKDVRLRNALKEPAADFYCLSLLVDFCLHASLYNSNAGPFIRLHQ